MPPLLSYDPNGATFSPITPDAYQQLVAKLKAAKVSKLIYSDVEGSCSTPQGVDFAWTYDGTTNLHIVVKAKHGFVVSHVPNATIFDKLRDEFFN